MPTSTKVKEREDEHVLEDLLVVQLRELYDVETQLVKTFPKMIKKTTNVALREVFEDMRAQTEGHAKRVEEALGFLEAKAQKLPSAAIRGLIEDAEWAAKNILGGAAIDAALVASFQVIQHYRLALYSTTFEWAKLLEVRGVVDVLEETVHDADEELERLDELAGSKINEAALGEDESGDEEEEEEDADEDSEEEEGDED